MNQIPSRDAPSPVLQDRRLAHLSLAFLRDEVTSGVANLGAMDALIVVAINQANIVPLTRDPKARTLYGGLDAPAPDAMRRPVSISAVATSLGLPFETVRRHVRRLEDQGVCRDVGAGVIVPESFLTSPEYLQSVVAAHVRLLAFYRAMKAADLIDPLPPSRYPDENETPVRAAARILADYILRTSEHLMALAGDVVSAVVLLGLLSSGCTSPTPAAVLARRLGLPLETARRHANRLVEAGRCERTGQGLLVTEAIMAEPAVQSFLRDNAANVQRLFAGLAERGVVAAWERGPA